MNSHPQRVCHIWELNPCITFSANCLISFMIKPDSDWKKYDEYAVKWSPYKTIASREFNKLETWPELLNANIEHLH